MLNSPFVSWFHPRSIPTFPAEAFPLRPARLLAAAPESAAATPTGREWVWGWGEE